MPKRTVTVFQTNASLRIYELIKSMGLAVVQMKCVEAKSEEFCLVVPVYVQQRRSLHGPGVD